MRTGTGLTHWKRVEGSKYAHCLQQWSAVWHLGHSAGKSEPAGSVVEQLKQRAAATACTKRGRRGPVTSIGGRGPGGRGRSSRRSSLFPENVAVRFLITALLVLSIAVHNVAGWHSLKCECSSRAA